MSDIVKPSVQAFLVCDHVIEDSVTKKKSLIGLFTHLQAVSFPFQHSQMGCISASLMPKEPITSTSI